jgi:hypothetical protein
LNSKLTLELTENLPLSSSYTTFKSCALNQKLGNLNNKLILKSFRNEYLYRYQESNLKTIMKKKLTLKSERHRYRQLNRNVKYKSAVTTAREFIPLFFYINSHKLLQFILLNELTTGLNNKYFI